MPARAGEVDPSGARRFQIVVSFQPGAGDDPAHFGAPGAQEEAILREGQAAAAEFWAGSSLLLRARDAPGSLEPVPVLDRLWGCLDSRLRGSRSDADGGRFDHP